MISFGTAAWGMRELPLEEQLRLTDSLGLKLIELSFANAPKDIPESPDSAKLSRVRALFEQFNFPFSCGCSGCDFTSENPVENRASLQKIKNVCRTAYALGLNQLRIFAGFASDSVVIGSRFENMIACLREAAIFAADLNLRLAMETHGGVAQNGDALVHFNSVSTRADRVNEILERIDLANFGLNFDPANLAAAGCPSPGSFFRMFHERVFCIHLKDFRKVPGGVLPAAAGEGILNWPELIRAIGEWSGPALMEYEPTGDVADGMVRSLRFLRKAFPEYSE